MDFFYAQKSLAHRKPVIYYLQRAQQFLIFPVLKLVFFQKFIYSSSREFNTEHGSAEPNRTELNRTEFFFYSNTLITLKTYLTTMKCINNLFWFWIDSLINWKCGIKSAYNRHKLCQTEEFLYILRNKCNLVRHVHATFTILSLIFNIFFNFIILLNKYTNILLNK